MADRLHKTIAEIEEISLTEFNEWMAYFKVTAKESSEDGGI